MALKSLTPYFCLLLLALFSTRVSAFPVSRILGVIGSENAATISTTSGMAPPMSPTTIYSSVESTIEYGYDGETQSESNRALRNEQQRAAWIERSINYYSKVARMESFPEYEEEFVMLAKKHYFAIRKVKDGKLHQAEQLYRRIIDELLSDDDECDHSKLAVTTLLYALLTKRMNDPKKTRAVFLNFFKLAVLEREEGTECACSAKVLQAYALFEMQQGNSIKSLEIVKRALKFDSSLAPVLQWKQFREVVARTAAAHP